MTSTAQRVFTTLCCDLLVYWKVLVVILTPIICLPLPIHGRTSVASCGYALLIMATYWVTEALPLAVTALLPIVLFPLLGILSGATVASAYIADVSVLLIAGLMMALAVEKCQLHARIALRILLLFGTKPAQILVGFMLPSWFLSMWLSNTATTGMMIPVAEKVIDEMWKQKLNRKPNTAASYTAIHGIVNQAYEPEVITRSEGSQQEVCTENEFSDRQAIVTNDVHTESANTERNKSIDRQMKKIAKMLTLSIVYSSNIGGTATLTGTPTNLIIADAANSLYEESGLDPPVTYVSWMLFGAPHAIFCLLFAYGWLVLVFLGWRVFYCCKADRTHRTDEEEMKKILRTEYQMLGPISFAEVSVSILFILLVFLWFARNPGFVPGYASLFKKGYVTDAVPAILVSILLFICPSEKPDWMCFRGVTGRAKRVKALLDWETVSTKLPWGVVFLLGGGYALADASQASGLSKFLGEVLTVFAPLPGWAVTLLIAVLVSLLTEITSNTAVVTVVTPIIIAMAKDLHINVVYLLLPAGMAASYAFMLPVATPPNAIAFSYGRLTVVDMARTGVVLNLLCISVVIVGVHTWGTAVFDLRHVVRSDDVNLTSVSPSTV